MACYCTPLEQRSAALHGYAHSYTPSLTLIEKSNDLAWSNSTAPTSASRAARTNQHIDNKHNSAALPCPLHCARDQLTPLRCTVPRDHYWRSGMLTSVNPALCSNRPALNRASVKPFFSCRRSCIRPVSRCQRIPTQAKLGGGDNQERSKGFITADEEPDEFFQTKAEKSGGLAPLKDPIAIVGILGILLPFVILGIAIGTGYVDVSPKMAKY